MADLGATSHRVSRCRFALYIFGTPSKPGGFWRHRFSFYIKLNLGKLFGLLRDSCRVLSFMTFLGAAKIIGDRRTSPHGQEGLAVLLIQDCELEVRAVKIIGADQLNCYNYIINARVNSLPSRLSKWS